MSDTNWSNIREEYEAGGISLRQLAKKHNVSKTYLIERRDKEKWNRPDRPPTVHASSAQRVSNPPTRDVNAVNRVAVALKLRAQKFTYEEIAQRAGYGSASACRKAVQRELQRIVVENVEELRREEAYMLDVAHSECWELFMDKSNTWRLTAYDRVLETSKDRRKLLNLDVKPDDILSGVTIIREYNVDISKV